MSRGQRTLLRLISQTALCLPLQLCVCSLFDAIVHVCTAQVFKRWADTPNNLVIFPGYCLIGTIGHKVLAGETSITVRLLGGPPSHLDAYAHAFIVSRLRLLQSFK